MNRLRNIFVIALNSLREYFHFRILFAFFMFSAIMVLFSILLGTMAVDNEKRVLTDFGLAISELVVLAFSIFHASMSIQKEIETKTIYLIISRPVFKSDYIIGKLFGIYITSGVLYVILSLINISILFLKGYGINSIYLISIVFSFCKIILISSISLFITSFSTSAFSSVIISILIWISGHFVSEMKYLLDKISGLKLYLIGAIIFALPNFQLLSVREVLQITDINYFYLFLYFFFYLFILLFANIFAFRKKEF